MDEDCNVMDEDRCGASKICSYHPEDGTCTLCSSLGEDECELLSCMWNEVEQHCGGSCTRLEHTLSYFSILPSEETNLQSEYACERKCMNSTNQCRVATFDEYGYLNYYHLKIQKLCP